MEWTVRIECCDDTLVVDGTKEEEITESDTDDKGCLEDTFDFAEEEFDEDEFQEYVDDNVFVALPSRVPLRQLQARIWNGDGEGEQYVRNEIKNLFNHPVPGVRDNAYLSFLREGVHSVSLRGDGF